MEGACSWIGSQFLWRKGRGARACSWSLGRGRVTLSLSLYL